MKVQVMDITETAMQDAEIVIRLPRINKREVYKIAKRVSNVKALMHKETESKISKTVFAIVKRILDICAGIIGTIVLIPLTLIIYIANIICGDGGPIFYFQDRIGKDGKYFKMYKFRTMVVDADKKLEELLANDENARKEWEENRKLKNDPRITKVGKILRKTSLDEWPQFLNVLKGDMSIVGPRAVIKDEIERFGVYKKDIFSVKPGITRILVRLPICR